MKFTREAREADERGWLAMMARTNGKQPDPTDFSDLIADLLVYAVVSGYATVDEVVDRALVHARAELEGDDLTTPED